MDKPTVSDQQINDEKQNTEDRLALEAVHDMCKFARNQFSAIDKNNDGFLTKLELDAAANSGRYKGEELKRVRILAEHVDQLQRVVHHGWAFGDDNYGAAWNDLAMVQMWAKVQIGKLEDMRAYRETFNRNFAKIDKNADKKISRSELLAASRSYEFNRVDRLNLADANCSWSLFRARELSPNFFDERLKEIEDRNSGDFRCRLIWSMADQSRK